MGGKRKPISKVNVGTDSGSGPGAKKRKTDSTRESQNQNQNQRQENNQTESQGRPQSDNLERNSVSQTANANNDNAVGSSSLHSSNFQGDININPPPNHNHNKPHSPSSCKKKRKKKPLGKPNEVPKLGTVKQNYVNPQAKRPKSTDSTRESQHQNPGQKTNQSQSRGRLQTLTSTVNANSDSAPSSLHQSDIQDIHGNINPRRNQKCNKHHSSQACKAKARDKSFEIANRIPNLRKYKENPSLGVAPRANANPQTKKQNSTDRTLENQNRNAGQGPKQIQGQGQTHLPRTRVENSVASLPSTTAINANNSRVVSSSNKKTAIFRPKFVPPPIGPDILPQISRRPRGTNVANKNGRNAIDPLVQKPRMDGMSRPKTNHKQDNIRSVNTNKNHNPSQSTSDVTKSAATSIRGQQSQCQREGQGQPHRNRDQVTVNLSEDALRALQKRLEERMGMKNIVLTMQKLLREINQEKEERQSMEKKLCQMEDNLNKIIKKLTWLRLVSQLDGQREDDGNENQLDSDDDLDDSSITTEYEETEEEQQKIERYLKQKVRWLNETLTGQTIPTMSEYTSSSSSSSERCLGINTSSSLSSVVNEVSLRAQLDQVSAALQHDKSLIQPIEDVKEAVKGKVVCKKCNKLYAKTYINKHVKFHCPKRH